MAASAVFGNRNLLKLSKKTLKIGATHGLRRAIRFLAAYQHLRTELNEKLDATIRRFRVDNPGAAYQKYLDIDYWLLSALESVYRLGLHTSAPKSILDIGTGAGYFPYACRYFGHEVEALDVPDNEMYNEIVEQLRIKRHAQRIIKFCQLEIERRFDLVTAFMVCFNNHRQADLWHCDEWQFFLSSVARHQLNEDGHIFLSLNAESDETPVDPALLSWFRALGAEVDGLEILINRQNVIDL